MRQNLAISFLDIETKGMAFFGNTERRDFAVLAEEGAFQ